MTIEALDAKDGWDVALKAPIPADATMELLNKARENVIEWLDYYSNDAPSGVPPEIMRIDLNQAVARLYEICVARQNAIEDRGSGRDRAGLPG
jgi:hypothetical protein